MQASIRVEAGSVLFREGDPGDCAYLLECGEVEVSVSRGGRRVVLGRKAGGELFGEMAVVDGRRRSATVTATTACQLIPVTGEQLRSRLEAADPVLRLTLSLLMDRLRSTVEQVQGTAACVRVGAPADPCGSVAHAAAVIRLEHELERALALGQLELHYQPIVALESGRVVGFEALARWRQPERGLLPPCAFLPAAEANGFIRRIDAWALAEGCAALQRFAKLSGPRKAPFVSVNVSAPSLMDPAFAERLESVVHAARVPPGKLRLEVTETSLIGVDLGGVLAGCRALGVGVSLDDFGTGYSSLSYLHRMPIDTLKLDRSFLPEAPGERPPAILRGVLRLTADLGLPVVAEGIERADQWRLLADLGARYGHGFHFSRPVPETAAAALLDEAATAPWAATARRGRPRPTRRLPVRVLPAGAGAQA